jgi:hypothetical protein
MKKEEMICTCEIGVSINEIRHDSGEKGILELINEFELMGIKVISRVDGMFNGDEEWELEGNRKALEHTLTTLGWDVSTIEFED